ncbi:YicC/YloC family endoribonuclease [Aliibacillus thermotolerans]|uniref:YicC/YloC family endoribonuclease n=1 Tax=Aliibacillus thermotolerans TaxID=1834418 RepID=A0ABW0U3Q9_9BACI|nr:YicC/YloC family endoribonuclease [Aliibacillus thermotolerans]MDA3130670.1 YicC family protein [Aliibacillus thermotolerans]
MVVSMTGYGQSEMENEEGRIVTEIKSVNHRFLDIQFRFPRELSILENECRKYISKKMKRGKIDVHITIEGFSPSLKKARIDWALLQHFLDHAEELEKLNIFDSRLDLQSFLFHPDIVVIEENVNLKDEWKEAIMESVYRATADLLEMKVEEGKQLQNDLETRVERLKRWISSMEKEAPLVAQQYRERLRERIQQLLQDQYEVDEQRLLTEVAIFSDKINIEEELTRLRSHSDQFLHVLHQKEPKGRKLDFLLQEMNREINTIASKANHIPLSHLAVDVKSELEKMKEQVQNIE